MPTEPSLEAELRPEVTHGDIELLARLQGLDIPAEHGEAIASALAALLESMRALDQLDLSEIEPIVHFDPRWD